MDELQELQEHAEHGKHHPDLAPVSLTMAFLAVFVATVSLLGHRSSTEEVILQNKVTDQWSYYQAKNIRRHNDELIAGLAGIVSSKDGEAAAKFQEKVRGEAEHGEAAAPVLLVERLEPGVLGGVPALRGGVDDEQGLPLVVRQGGLLAVDGLQRDHQPRLELGGERGL